MLQKKDTTAMQRMLVTADKEGWKFNPGVQKEVRALTTTNRRGK